MITVRPLSPFECLVTLSIVVAQSVLALAGHTDACALVGALNILGIVHTVVEVDA